jgi:hypothetical protein
MSFESRYGRKADGKRSAPESEEAERAKVAEDLEQPGGERASLELHAGRLGYLLLALVKQRGCVSGGHRAWSAEDRTDLVRVWVREASGRGR